MNTEFMSESKIGETKKGTIMTGALLKYVNVPYDKVVPFLEDIRRYLVTLGIGKNWATIFVACTIMNEFLECNIGGPFGPGGPRFENLEDLQEYEKALQDRVSSLNFPLRQ